MSSAHARRAASEPTPAWFYAYVPVNLASGATAPLIPLYMVMALHASVLDVGLLFCFTSLAAVPGAVFWGRLSDKLHQRRVFVLLGLAAFAATLPVMALTRDLGVYLAANTLLGFLQAAGAATATVLIMESKPQREWPRQIGKFAQVSGIAFVAGLVVGALWFAAAPGLLGGQAALEAMFLIGAAMSGASVLLGMATLKEGHHRVDRSAAVSALAHLGHSIVERRHVFLVRFTHISALSWAGVAAAARKPIGAYCFGIFLLFTGFLVFNAPLPVFLLKEAGLAQDLIFVVYVANSGLAAALYALAGRRCEAHSPRRILALSAGARIVIYPAFAVAVLALGPSTLGALIAVSLLNALAGACWAFINVGSSVLASNLAEPEAKGQAMGLYNAAIGAGAIAGSLLGGLFAQAMPYLLVFGAASAIIAAGVVVVLVAAAAPEPGVPAGKPLRKVSGSDV